MAGELVLRTRDRKQSCPPPPVLKKFRGASLNWVGSSGSVQLGKGCRGLMLGVTDPGEPGQGLEGARLGVQDPGIWDLDLREVGAEGGAGRAGPTATGDTSQGHPGPGQRWKAHHLEGAGLSQALEAWTGGRWGSAGEQVGEAGLGAMSSPGLLDGEGLLDGISGPPHWVARNGGVEVEAGRGAAARRAPEHTGPFPRPLHLAGASGAAGVGGGT